jgi:hypothetical protein
MNEQPSKSARRNRSVYSEYVSPDARRTHAIATESVTRRPLANAAGARHTATHHKREPGSDPFR